jgi:hypothetical protein
VSVSDMSDPSDPSDRSDAQPQEVQDHRAPSIPGIIRRAGTLICEKLKK